MGSAPKVSIVAVLLGQAIDKVLFIPLVVLLATNIEVTSLTFSLTTLVLGTSCTLVGSYSAARYAKSRFVLHGILVAAITVILSFARFVNVQLGDEPSIHPIWWELIAWSLSFVAGYVGGYFAMKTVAHDA